MDAGTLGLAINAANRLQTGRFWQIETCDGKSHDQPQEVGPGTGRDTLLGKALALYLPPGLTPIYPASRTATARPERPRRAPDPPNGAEGDDRRHRPPQRGRAQARAVAAGVPAPLGSHLQPLLGRRGELPADLQPGRRGHAVGQQRGGLRQGLADDPQVPQPQALLRLRLRLRPQRVQLGCRASGRTTAPTRCATRSGRSAARSSTASAAARAPTTSTTTACRTTGSTPTGSRTCARSAASRSTTRWVAAPRPTCRCGSAPRAFPPAAAARRT